MEMLRTRIVGVETLGSYQAYVIECVLGEKKWVVKQRYSAFDEVRKVVMRENVHIVAPFPAKSMFGTKLTEAQTIKRREQLQTWLQALCSPLPKNDAARRVILDFLQEPTEKVSIPIAEGNQHNDTLTATTVAQWDESFMSHDPLAAVETDNVTEKPPPCGAIETDSTHTKTALTKKERKGEPSPHSTPVGEAPSFLLSSGILQSSEKNYDHSGEGLRDAVKDGNLQAVTELLASDPSLANYQDRQMESMLHLACIFNNADIALTLVRAGAKTNVKNHNGETPLDLALPSLANNIRNAREG
mmetsp:Transcript_14993/g.18494  ORF Transcript_14993/g.18494 Transcript_14993/m.18494 type:complete len:301 (-) Transcript_14993:171-1073(-)